MSQFRNVLVLPILVLLVAVWSVDSVQAQPRGRGFGFRGFSMAQLASLEKVQGELKLSDSQKTKVAEISEQLNTERRELFSGVGGVTADQKDAFQKLLGEKLEIDLSELRGGGGRRNN